MYKSAKIVHIIGLLFFMALAVAGQQSAPAPRQEVPDNIAPHPAPTQPLPYSHKTHIALGLQCQGCHINPAPGIKMTFPATALCTSCHNNTDKKLALSSLDKYAISGQPIPWRRVYTITAGVSWSHRAHLQAGMQCVMCHGDVSQSDAMAETTAIAAMASCISCHQTHNASATCETCHAWPMDKALGLKKISAAE